MKETRIRWDELNYASLIMQVLRNLWAAALITISAILVYVGVVRLTYQPKYISNATLMVSATDSTNPYNSLTVTQSMAEVFAEVFQSNVLREQVENRMGDDAFTGLIETEVVPETNLLTLSVTAETPEMAFRGLSIIVEEHGDLLTDHIYGNAKLEVIKDPVVPMVPSNPLPLRRNATIVGMLTAILSLAAIAGLCALQDTVGTPKAAQRKLDARLLRTVHHETRNKTYRLRLRRKRTVLHESNKRTYRPRRRKRIAPLINAPLISAAFVEDSQSLCTAVEYHTRKRNQQVILITSSGENEGKSTIAANLALALAGRNKKVALLDCDFRKPSLHKVLEAPVPKEQRFSACMTADNGVDILVEHHGLLLGTSNPNHKTATTLIGDGRLAAFIARLRTQVDYIVLDTPPMLAAADAEAIAHLADTALMVVRADFMPTGAINDCLDNLRNNSPDVAGVVLNNYRSTLL